MRVSTAHICLILFIFVFNAHIHSHTISDTIFGIDNIKLSGSLKVKTCGAYSMPFKGVM